MRVSGRCLWFLLLAWVAGSGTMTAADATWAEVQKILNDHCLDCHGETKQKHGLRLDSPEWLNKGSKEGPVVVAGKPDKSPLYTLAALPADDEDRMPPKGERLTPDQLAALQSWIAAGAVFTAKPISGPATTVPATPTGVIPPAPDVPAAVLEVARQEQLMVTTYAGGWLGINAAHTRNGITEEQLQLLAKLAPAVITLDLAGSGITDRQVRLLKPFNHLQRLHLERNPLSDAALVNLPTLNELTYLNLVATGIGDAGLGELKRQPALRDLYLWQTKATPVGIAKLTHDQPELSVGGGPDGLPTVSSAPERKKHKK